MSYPVGCSLIQLALFLAIAVMTPLLLRIEVAYNHRYMHGMVDNLHRENPEILLIGNSMLETRIDINELKKISGKRISLLTKGGSASACWYLYLKNVVAASSVQPEHVIIFFRDKVLTWPEYRTEGHYANYLKRLEDGDEPLLNQILATRRNSPFGLSSKIHTIYGLNTQPRSFGSNVHDLALDLTQMGSGKRARRLVMNKRFSVDNLRHDLIMENAAYETSAVSKNKPRHFSPASDSSFLPHIIDLAVKINTNLGVYQVNNRFERTKRPLQAGHIKYLSDLEDYLKSRNVLTLKEPAKDVPEHWFAEGDHIAKDHRTEYTRLFWENIKDSLLAPK